MTNKSIPTIKQILAGSTSMTPFPAMANSPIAATKKRNFIVCHPLPIWVKIMSCFIATLWTTKNRPKPA